jgi:hypothetical protein
MWMTYRCWGRNNLGRGTDALAPSSLSIVDKVSPPLTIPRLGRVAIGRFGIRDGDNPPRPHLSPRSDCASYLAALFLALGAAGLRGMGHNDNAYICDHGGNGDKTSHSIDADAREDNYAAVEGADAATMMQANSFDHSIGTDPGEDNHAVVLLHERDIILNFRTHHGTKVLREYIKGKMALLNFPFLEREEQDIIIDQTIVHSKQLGNSLYTMTC